MGTTFKEDDFFVATKGVERTKNEDIIKTKVTNSVVVSDLTCLMILYI